MSRKSKPRLAERDALQAKLDALEVKLPCGCRKIDNDDSYGGCVFCGFKNGYEEYEREIMVLEAERDEARALLQEVMAKVLQPKIEYDEWRDLCFRIAALVGEKP